MARFSIRPGFAVEHLELDLTANGSSSTPGVILSNPNVHAHLSASQAREMAQALLEMADQIEQIEDHAEFP